MQAFLSGLRPPDRFPGRMAVARAVCGGLCPFDVRGRPRIPGCMAALAALEAEGALRLPPEGSGKGVTRTPGMRSAPVAEPTGAPNRPGSPYCSVSKSLT